MFIAAIRKSGCFFIKKLHRSGVLSLIVDMLDA